MSRLRPAVIASVAAVVLLGAFLLASGADEGEALKQIKSDVFEQKWDGVLGGCSQFITQFPRSPDLSRAYYYRAQALEHGKGREEEAIAAYTDFVTRFPNEAGALKEDALLSRITLATGLYLKGNKKYVQVILQGMDEKGYPGIYAAIQGSKIDHAPARAKALNILLRCAGSESDAEMKNECLLGVLRIDPEKLKEVRTPPPPPAPPKVSDALPAGPLPPGPPAPGDKVKLIRVEVYDKVKKQVSVRVNMPVTFAELLFDSLSAELHQEIDQELKKKGIALERFWESFKKAGKQTIVEIDDDTHHIKVWVE